MPTTVRSFCKINLGLAVGPPRPDGYHGLTTLYQTLALHDRVTVMATTAAATRITLETNHAGVPSTATGDADRNTAYRIVAAALERLGMAAEVHLRIDKRLPVQGGLGAGSANAAAALLALERELKEALDAPSRLRLAAEIGSDVPLFLLGGTVLGIDRGQQVFPLPDLPPTPAVIAVPAMGVSTAQAFRDLDARLDAQAALQRGAAAQNGLTSPPILDRLDELSHVLASAWTPTGVAAAGREPTGIADSSLRRPPARNGQGSYPGDLAEIPGSSSRSWNESADPLLALVRTGVENDFEEVAFRQHPSLRNIKRALTGSLDAETLLAALSGSGSALFGLYRSPEAARAAQQRVQALGTVALLTETLPRQGYWRQMFA